VFIFPSAVVHELESLFRDFLWAQGGNSKARCRIAWSSVCEPKDCGGLGFKRLSTSNLALIAKHVWDIIAGRDSVWVNWTREQYLSSTNFWLVRKSSRWSWVFRKIMDTRPCLRRFFHLRVGDGLATNAWEDTWLPCGPLSSIVSYRLIHMAGFTVDTTVAQFLTHNGGVWPAGWG